MELINEVEMRCLGSLQNIIKILQLFHILIYENIDYIFEISAIVPLPILYA